MPSGQELRDLYDELHVTYRYLRFPDRWPYHLENNLCAETVNRCNIFGWLYASIVGTNLIMNI